MEKTAAILRRVSDVKQGGEAQNVLERWAADRGLKVPEDLVFALKDSAWNKRGPKGEEFDRARAAILEAARLGKFNVLLIWALDRLSRRGIRDSLTVLEQLRDYGVEVWSHEESWLATQSDTWDLQVSIMAYMAEQESKRKSARMQQSIAERRRAGRPIGRGSAPDAKPRKRSGYVRAWEEGGRNRDRDPDWSTRNRARDDHGQFKPGEEAS
jgi:putative DNA-invertase from lambdoid prophage Rac